MSTWVSSPSTFSQRPNEAFCDRWHLRRAARRDPGVPRGARGADSRGRHGLWNLPRCVALALFACAGTLLPACVLADDERPEALPIPPLERVVRIHDAASAARLSLEELCQRLLEADVIFLGETHLDETTHRFEARIYRELIERTGGRVVLAMEMFERDVQEALDAYVDGSSDEETFLASARPWSNYRTGYRPMIELAREHRLPVVASNFPVSVRRKLGFRGKAAYEALSDEDRRWLPKELHHNSDEYWERFSRAVRGHLGDMLKGDPDRRLYSTQCLWDNAMGEACALALEHHPGWRVLHINGGFHTAFHQGTVEQFRHRNPQAKVLTIDVAPVSDLASIDPDPGDESADFTVYAESRARGLQDGTHAVQVSRELTFRLHMPSVARDAAPPLLIWLPRAGLRAEQALEYLRLAFGDEIAIACVEPPFPTLEEDLRRGGRWYWEEDFSAHVGALHQGITRLLGGLLAKFPVRSDRVVLAGEGSAATAVASLMLYSRSALPVQAFAIAPRQYAKLREGSLPEPAEPDAPYLPFEYRDLVVFSDPSSHEWWQEEVDDYRSTGMRVDLVPLDASDPARQVENGLRAALGLPSLAARSGDSEAHDLFVLRVDSPIARFWAECMVRASVAAGRTASVTTTGALADHIAAQQGKSLRVIPLVFRGEPLDAPFPPDLSAPLWSAEDARSGELFPLPPGQFGGTTLIVTMPDASPEEEQVWAEIADLNPLSERNRFARLRVAFTSGRVPGVAEVVDEIAGGGTSDILVVPCAFCAAPDEMRALRDMTRGHGAGASLHWLPGLGGRLHRLARPAGDGSEL